ncbi:rCG39145 [Rattus norvegicus]|uniref:RCG39145 n=1 Tax=Rattus norvegicus TaxID=10116 RepID=A6JY85_RAT|nr:rCG39145 [Rattus norvegicus]
MELCIERCQLLDQRRIPC